MRGFTVAEIAVLALVMAVFAAIVVWLAPAPEVRVEPRLEIDGRKLAREFLETMRELEREEWGGGPGAAPVPMEFEAIKAECMNNVRLLVGLLEVTSVQGYPKRGGANLILSLVKMGELEGEDSLRLLFCPGDPDESLELAGGKEAYERINLSEHVHDHLTSYAGRDLLETGCGVKRDPAEIVALVCDDSEEHHDGVGFVVGFTGGAVKWREKGEDWKVDPRRAVVIGKDSTVPELRCMRAD